MYIKTTEFGSKPEFVASDHYVNYTATISDSGVSVVDGKKIVARGSFIGSDGKVVTDPGSQAVKGILFHDVDVTSGPLPGALMIHGFVYDDRLPAASDSDVKAALPGITFITKSDPVVGGDGVLPIPGVRAFAEFLVDTDKPVTITGGESDKYNVKIVFTATATAGNETATWSSTTLTIDLNDAAEYGAGTIQDMIQGATASKPTGVTTTEFTVVGPLGITGTKWAAAAQGEGTPGQVQLAGGRAPVTG